MRQMTRHLLILLILFFSILNCVVTSSNEVSTSKEEALTLTPKHTMARDLGFFEFSQKRRKLGSFQVCAPCTCCGGGSKELCLLSPCCYAINCNIPNRPFGYCSFSPKSCNCTVCNA